MNISCDHDGDLEVTQSLNLRKRLRVLVNTLLDVLYALRIKSSLGKAARLAIRLRVDDNRQRDSFKDRTDKAPELEGVTPTSRGLGQRYFHHPFYRSFFQYTREK